MRTIKVMQGQSLFDVALQEMGSVEGVLKIALANGLSITEALSPDQKILVPDSLINRAVVQSFRSHALRPATIGSFKALKQKLFTNGLFENGLFE